MTRDSYETEDIERAFAELTLLRHEKAELQKQLDGYRTLIEHHKYHHRWNMDMNALATMIDEFVLGLFYDPKEDLKAIHIITVEAAKYLATKNTSKLVAWAYMPQLDDFQANSEESD